MTIKYVFREDEPIRIMAAKKAGPQQIGEALTNIAEKNGGRLTPGDVVESARGKRHVLHPFFEWDDGRAAEAYRLDQARTLIRIVRVADDEGEGRPRAFLSIADRDGVAYRTVADVRSSADLQMVVMRQAQRDLESFQRRFRELADVCSIIQQAREKIAERQAKHESRASVAA